LSVFQKFIAPLILVVSSVALAPAAFAANPMADIDRQTLTNLLVAAPGLSRQALEHGLKAARCAASMDESSSPLLTIIDYSKPSKSKRMWVLDIKRDKVVYNEWVAHGVNSGNAKASKFSNRVNSRQTSLGVYRTAETYSGKHGYSLKLDGLDGEYNNRARERAIVIHGASYVDGKNAKRTGRIGRSWGCPALRKSVSRNVINTIKNGSLVVAYYPQKAWMQKSAFLNCPAATLPRRNVPQLQIVQGDTRPPRLLLATPEPIAALVASRSIQSPVVASISTVLQPVGNRYFETAEPAIIETVVASSSLSSSLSSSSLASSLAVPVVKSFSYDINGYVAERPTAFSATAAASVSGAMVYQSDKGYLAADRGRTVNDYAFDSVRNSRYSDQVNDDGDVVQSVAANEMEPSEEVRHYRFSRPATDGTRTSFSFLR